MPTYIYKHPQREEYIEIIQSMNEKHIFFDEEGIEWKRVWTNPQLNTESSIDPFNSKAFVEKTGNMKGTYGDLQNYSKELSEQRKKIHGGVDPVQQKYFKQYSKERKGAKHINEMKQRTFENKNWKISYD
jgi:hypothetical protein